MNRCKKKVIPWHVQQRYMESFSQLSLNQTLSTAMYKKKIRYLQKNNRDLATALQRSRGLATDKENLLIDNGKILSIINFSRLKLMDMAVNMKQAAECLDETLLLLNSSLTDSLSKESSINLNYRKDFKNKLQAIGRNSPIQEVSENSDNSNKAVESYAQKGKISRVDGCGSPPNKRSRLTKKEKSVNINCQGHKKSAEETSSVIPTISSKNTNLKNSRICGSALNIKSLKRKKLSKNSNTESASSPKFSPSSSKLFLQTKTKQKSLGNKHKTAKVVLTDIAEVFLAQGTENDHSPVSNGLNSALNGTNVKCFPPNSPEDDVLIKKYFSSEPISKQNSSSSNLNCSEFATNDNVEVPGHSQNIYNSSNLFHKELSFGDISVIEKEPLSFSTVNEDSVFAQASDAIKMECIEDDFIPEQSKGMCIKKTDSEKEKGSCKSQNLKGAKRVSFYFDEDAIEKVGGNAVTSKDRILNNKCKARKTVSHNKKGIPSEGTVLKSNLILPDSVSKLGKNSFLVTAEVHSPLNGICAQKFKSKICVSEKMEPCVVLTDIFKSNRGLLSEMVGDGLQKNVCLQETVTEKSVAPLAEMNTYTVNNNSACDRNGIYVLYEDDTENRCLPGNIEILKRSHRRGSKNVCYKEPSLNIKMRRL